MFASHPPSGSRVATLKDLGVGRGNGTRLQPCLVDPVEISFECKRRLGPQPLEYLDELFRATIALVMLQPRFAESAELILEPATQHVDCKSALRIDVDCGSHLRHHSGVPEARMNGADQFDTLGVSSD